MLRVMSFNLRYGTAPDGPHHWEARRALAIARITALAPDLLGVQECRADAQAEYVRAHLPDYDFYGLPRGGEHASAPEMTAIFLRRATIRRLEAGTFWLSETPTLAGSRGWDAHFPRTATWAEVTHLPTGQRLTYLNTHFDYAPDAIEGASRQLAGWVAARHGPLVVTGDFNAEKDSPAYARLLAAGPLTDALRAGRPAGAEDGTFHDFGCAARQPAIDWVLASAAFHVRAAGVDRWSLEGRYPSDHHPVWADLAWPEAA